MKPMTQKTRRAIGIERGRQRPASPDGGLHMPFSHG